MEISAVGVSATDLRRAVSFYSDRKSTRLNSSHRCNSYAVFCLKKQIARSGNGDGTVREVEEVRTVCRIVGAARVKLFFFSWCGDHRDLHSFPTRRTSD